MSDICVGPNGGCPFCYRRPCICRETEAETAAREARERKRMKAHGTQIETLECQACKEYGVVPDDVRREYICLKCGHPQVGFAQQQALPAGRLVDPSPPTQEARRIVIAHSSFTPCPLCDVGKFDECYQSDTRHKNDVTCIRQTHFEEAVELVEKALQAARVDPSPPQKIHEELESRMVTKAEPIDSLTASANWLARYKQRFIDVANSTPAQAQAEADSEAFSVLSEGYEDDPEGAADEVMSYWCE